MLEPEYADWSAGSMKRRTAGICWSRHVHTASSKHGHNGEHLGLISHEQHDHFGAGRLSISEEPTLVLSSRIGNKSVL